ncbi:MAG: bifunctional DNA-formamidopyrimidine glycosylase/DNA-(apurinic or apyrimidinic site) lyase [Gemmatimonadetes bacterium]|nr:MAG: bifunctional DNA-formamidopyrimidine glycosylase/DNA-(apurinic or apyrimidinic site) lyase [Gemmatimonadota bacterium]
MPELPEVETIVRELRQPLVGRTFTQVIVRWEKTIQTPVAEFKHNLPGKQIESIRRRAKYIWFHLSGGWSLFIHLKMSGNLQVLPVSTPCEKHVHTILRLDNGHEVRFKDTRKFGRAYLTRDPETVTGHLGPEPLADNFTLADFKALFHRKKGRLKPLLLNQAFIAGLGNIYADEACHDAGILPNRTADTLSAVELERLYHSIRKVLNHGIMHRGATFDEVYPGGKFQNFFQVYGRTGEPCRTCDQPVERIVLSSRSTHFCPNCQR